MLVMRAALMQSAGQWPEFTKVTKLNETGGEWPHRCQFCLLYCQNIVRSQSSGDQESSMSQAVTEPAMMDR